MDRPPGDFLDFKFLPGFKPKDSGRGRLFLAYAGNSMNPTLREPELMEVMPYRGRQIRRGDVICFTRHGEGTSVVHRVIGITEQGIATRGDHNPGADSWRIVEEQVIGRVATVWVGSKRRLVLGGWSGYLLGQTLYGMRWLDRKFSHWLSPLYGWLSETGFVSRLLPKSLRPRAIRFRQGGRERLLLFWGGTLIGQHNGKGSRWIIRRPFRLIANERFLEASSPD